MIYFSILIGFAIAFVIGGITSGAFHWPLWLASLLAIGFGIVGGFIAQRQFMKRKGKTGNFNNHQY
jgi:hypothetical protein